MHARLYLIDPAAGRHSIDHLLDQDRRIWANEMKSQQLSAVCLDNRLGEAIFLHHGFPLSHVEVPSLVHYDLVSLSGGFLGQPHGRDLGM